MQRFIIALLIIIVIQLLYIILYKQTERIEGMESLTDEAIQNIASIYNSGTMKVTNLEVSGGIKTDRINTLTNDWLRLNEYGSGKTAFWGGVAIAGEKNGNSGLAVGAHNAAIGNGKILGTTLQSTNTNSTNVTATNVVAEKTTSPNVITQDINTPVGHDWLRINWDKDGAGRVALCGNLSVNDTRKNFGGLSVGSWNPNYKSGRIGIEGNWQIGNRLNHLIFEHGGTRQVLSPDGKYHGFNDAVSCCHWTLP